jgi:hypothetical protein
MSAKFTLAVSCAPDMSMLIPPMIIDIIITVIPDDRPGAEFFTGRTSSAEDLPKYSEGDTSHKKKYEPKVVCVHKGLY